MTKPECATCTYDPCGYGEGYECIGYRPRDTKKNLCPTCINEVAVCDGNPLFGDGIGNDNVYGCNGYMTEGDD